MKVTIQAVNFNIDKDLKVFIEDKLDILDKFYDRIIGAEVFLKVQSTSDKDNKEMEIVLKVPGNDVIVSKKAKTFEEGIKLNIEALKRSLKKIKEKQNKH